MGSGLCTEEGFPPALSRETHRLTARSSQLFCLCLERPQSLTLLVSSIEGEQNDVPEAGAPGCCSCCRPACLPFLQSSSSCLKLSHPVLEGFQFGGKMNLGLDSAHPHSK